MGGCGSGRRCWENVSALVGPASQHCSIVRGGAGLSTYAEEWVLQIERRTLPGETPEAVIKELNDLVTTTESQAEVRLLLARPPLTCDRDARIAECLRRSAAFVNAAEAEEIGELIGWMRPCLPMRAFPR